MALIISTWLWGTKYGQEYVDKLKRGVSTHMREPYEFRVFTPLLVDAPLTAAPGCFARLRMFSPEWQEQNGIKPGDKIVCLDLDMVVTGGLDRLWARNESFVILQGANSSNPCKFNGSVMMLRAGEHREVWDDFDFKKVGEQIEHYAFPDDQGWLWHKLPDAAGWKCGAMSGVYAFGKPGWPEKSYDLPNDARLVAFPGWRDPSKFLAVPWIREHWS